MFRREESGAKLLISNELEQARRQLRERKEQLQAVLTAQLELTDTINRLQAKITQLEQDEKALSRGYAAMAMLP